MTNAPPTAALQRGRAITMQERVRFVTQEGHPVPAVTTAQMREVDRMAVEEFGLGLLQMMENAGRILAAQALDMWPGQGHIVIVAGSGGNGGGGLCCARHLLNRGLPVRVVLDRPAHRLRGGAAHQWRILHRAGVEVLNESAAFTAIKKAGLIVDALIGYGLRAAAREGTARWIRAMNASSAPVLSLDVPSGLDATTGEAKGHAVTPDRILTLALPKTGLVTSTAPLYLADIGIPPAVYERLGIDYTPVFGASWWVRLLVDTPADS